MTTINDFVGQLSIGSLVLCKFNSISDRYLKVAGIYDLDEKKVFVGMPDEMKGEEIVECMPALITGALLMQHGFEAMVPDGEDAGNTSYRIKLKNRNTLIAVPRPENIRWNVHISSYTGEDIPENIIYLGHTQYFFKIQDTYRSLTSKNL